jgi:hypothetical protein
MVTELHSPVILPSLRNQIQMTITEDAPLTLVQFIPSIMYIS